MGFEGLRSYIDSMASDIEQSGSVGDWVQLSCSALASPRSYRHRFLHQTLPSPSPFLCFHRPQIPTNLLRHSQFPSKMASFSVPCPKTSALLAPHSNPKQIPNHRNTSIVLFQSDFKIKPNRALVSRSPSLGFQVSSDFMLNLLFTSLNKLLRRLCSQFVFGMNSVILMPCQLDSLILHLCTLQLLLIQILFDPHPLV